MALRDHRKQHIHRRTQHNLQNQCKNKPESQSVDLHNTNRHYKRHNQRRQNILHLLKVRIADQFLVRRGIDKAANDRRKHTRHCDGNRRLKAEHRDHQRHKPIRLFDDLQPEEQVAAAHRVDCLQITGVHGKERKGEAVNLHVWHTRQPLVREQELDERLRHGRKPSHHWEDDIRAERDRIAHYRLDARPVVLVGGDRRKHHALYRAVDRANHELRELFSSVIKTQRAAVVFLSDHQAAQILIQRVQQRGNQQLPTVGKQHLDPRKIAYQPRPPLYRKPHHDARYDDVEQRLRDERPKPRAHVRQRNTDAAGHDDRRDVAAEHLLEVHVAADLRQLDGVQRAWEEHQR